MKSFAKLSQSNEWASFGYLAAEAELARMDKNMKRSLLIIRILAAVALALSAYILWTSLSQTAELAGCGEGSGCETVLQTKWSSWFGLPVSAAALLVYGSILVITFFVSTDKTSAWLFLLFFSVLASSSGVWFMLLQTFLIKSYCIYCSIVHVCGILIAMFVLKAIPVQEEQSGKKKKAEPAGIPVRKFFYAGLCGILAVGVLALGQTRSSDMNTAEIPKSSVNSSIEIKTVRLLNGTVPVSVGEFPVLGASDPDHVVAHLFDYTCPACRKLHPALLQALEANPQGASLVMVPMPLDEVCNPGVQQTSYQHLNACAYARLGLAIWRAKPDAYPSYDHFMFQSEFPPSLESARAVADQLVGSQTIQNALVDSDLDRVLRTGIGIFYSPAMERKVLPILITPEKATYGIPAQPDLNALFAHH